MSRKLGLFGHNMQNGKQQRKKTTEENKKCDIRNYGWEGMTRKT